MVTNFLEKCCDIVSYECFHNQESVDLLLHKQSQIKSKLIIPFRRELDRNMLIRPTPGEKTDLIIYYVVEFMKVMGRLPDFRRIEFEIPYLFDNLRYSDKTGEMSKIDKLQVNRHYVYSLLFDQIQNCCFNFKIPFRQVCIDLWFPMNVINMEITEQYEEYLGSLANSLSALPEHQKTTDRLRGELRQKGFFELGPVVALPDAGKETLLRIIAGNEVPYKIAMFDFLGFITHMSKEFDMTRSAIYKSLADILQVVQRTVKGNVLVLQDHSKEDRDRYTAYKYKEQVRNDYQMLK
jgi:hypothetical protein